MTECRVPSAVPRRMAFALPLSALALLPNLRVLAQAATSVTTLPRLTYAGAILAPVSVDPAYVHIRVVVDLGGDVPLASYIAARPRGMPALQRTESGAWVVWDQRPRSLIDNGFASSEGNLVFEDIGADFTRQSFPIALEVAYRTLSGVKFGLLTMLSRR
jgi:hypothetical protein